MGDVPDMVERVARAMCKEMGFDPDWTGYQSGPADDARPTWQRQARVARSAIEAMRMTHERGDAPDIIQAKRVWNAGIDAALASPTKE